MFFARKLSYHKLLSVSVGVMLLCLLWLMPTTAAAQSGTAAISQGFATSGQTLADGTLLSLEQQNQAIVEMANTGNASSLVGVVNTQPLLAVTGDTGNQQEVQVVISGTTQALVSDINGPIKAGDKITASPISGVGMKATNSAEIIGSAESDFDTSKVRTQTIKDTSGHNHVVHVGLMSVQINVSYYNAPAKSSVLPSFLQNFANSIAGGRDVSAVRILMGGTVLLLGLVSIGALMSSAVRSSIISIGRNPLSESAVQKSLLTVGLTGLGILLLVVIAIYLIIRI